MRTEPAGIIDPEEEEKRIAEEERWVLLELMGHRRLAGKLTEETIGGASFLRIDVPDGATQFYSPAAVYAITPITEDVARRFAQRNRPTPIQTYELPKPDESDFDDEDEPF